MRNWVRANASSSYHSSPPPLLANVTPFPPTPDEVAPYARKWPQWPFWSFPAGQRCNSISPAYLEIGLEVKFRRMESIKSVLLRNLKMLKSRRPSIPSATAGSVRLSSEAGREVRGDCFYNLFCFCFFLVLCIWCLLRTVSGTGQESVE